MKHMDLEVEDLKKIDGFYTAKEITSQPALWKETYLKLVEEKNQVLKFINGVFENDNTEVILTGAGTSAFIGEVLAGPFQKMWNVPCKAVGTTEIITHPENYFSGNRPTLLISFARSGDSPESVAAVELAHKHCEKLYELNITCNAHGKLARMTGNGNSYVFLLPEETNDQSLAMTSSFSSMLLAGLLILNIKNIEQLASIISKISSLGTYILTEQLSSLKKAADFRFERMVFLGSGPLFGVAHESHLKVQELSDGKIICKFDSFLGFRHGPKAVVNNSTVVVYLLTNNAYARPYELDLIKSVNETAAGEKTIAIGNGYDETQFRFDIAIRFPDHMNDIPEEFLSVFYVLPAQIIGFYKSLNLGLSPDSPSRRGSISRVVQGVKIYHRESK
jgi:tagatose-6-phosphate ketose/aldose isomerase